MESFFGTIFVFLILTTIAFCISPKLSLNFVADSDVQINLHVRDRLISQVEKFNFNTKDRLLSSAFDYEKPSIFIVHGFQENYKANHYLALSK